MPIMMTEELYNVRRTRAKESASWFTRRVTEFGKPVDPVHAYKTGFEDGFKEAVEFLQKKEAEAAEAATC